MNRARTFIRGFTLVELTISLGVCALLVTAMGGVVLLSTKAVPSGNSAGGRVARAARGTDLLATELYYAQNFSNLSASSVTFTVAPRGTDAGPETITYSWSGIAGDPLLRQYNNGPPTAVVLNVNRFSLTYNKVQRQVVQTVTSSSTTPEQLLVSCTGWSGVAPTYNDFAASQTNQIAEYFTVPNSTSFWPSGATLNITRVRLPLKSYPGGGASYTVGLYEPHSTNGPDPSNSPVGSPVTVSASTLSASYVWTDIYLSGASVTSPMQNGFCVVVSAPTTAASVYAQYISSASAPSDTPTMQTSSDGGATWGPTTNTNQQDLQFSCYGTFTTTTSTQQLVTNTYLPSVTMQLQTGADASAPLNTTIEVYTQPNVNGL